MNDSTYEKVVGDVAKDLCLSEETLRTVFPYWLNDSENPALSPTYAAACYAVYRLTKQVWAFEVTSCSRAHWRVVALALGANPILGKNSAAREEGT